MVTFKKKTNPKQSQKTPLLKTNKTTKNKNKKKEKEINEGIY